MKTKILIFLFIIASILTAQEKKFYVKAGGGVQGMGNSFIDNYYKEINSEYNKRSDIDFKSSIMIVLGTGYKINDYLAFEIIYNTNNFEENMTNASTVKGYSVSPFIKGIYPISESAYLFIAIGYGYNKLEKEFSYSYYKQEIVGGPTELVKKSFKEDLSTNSWNFKLGTEISVYKSLSVFAETGISLISKKVDNPNYESGANMDPRNIRPVDSLLYSEYTFNNISISAGISYYIF